MAKSVGIVKDVVLSNVAFLEPTLHHYYIFNLDHYELLAAKNENPVLKPAWVCLIRVEQLARVITNSEWMPLCSQEYLPLYRAVYP